MIVYYDARFARPAARDIELAGRLQVDDAARQWLVGND